MNERPDRRIPLTQPALDLAAHLWAETRRSGKPTADPHALDIDLILTAQVRLHSTSSPEKLVLTSNPAHLSLHLPTLTPESL